MKDAAQSSSARPRVFVALAAEDAARVQQVLGSHQLIAVTDAASLRSMIRPFTGECVILSVHAGTSAWAELLSDPPCGLIALLGEHERAQASAWLAAGGHDWVFRDTLELLPAIITRVTREIETTWRIRRAANEMMGLARHPAVRGDDLDAALRAITEAGVRALAANHCSVWLFDENSTHLRLIDECDASMRHGRPERQPNPELMLEVPLSFRGDAVGVLRFERDSTQVWARPQQAFAQALGDIVIIALDNADRTRTAATLLSSERRFRELFNRTSDAVVLYRVALDGSVYCEDLNAAAETLAGVKREEAIGSQLIEPQITLRERYAEAIRTRLTLNCEHTLEVSHLKRWFNTTLVPILDESGRVQRLASFSRDVTLLKDTDTRQRRLDAELSETQKNEALVRLATNVARELQKWLDVIEREVASPSADVSRATLSARTLSQQLLALERRRPTERRPVDFERLVRDCVTRLAPSARLETAPARVNADAAQVTQALEGVFAHALAIQHTHGGQILIRLAKVEVDYALALEHPPLQAGRWARLSIDSTAGLSTDASRRRLFEPYYFGLEGPHAGAGLQLALAQSIVRGHDGVIVVEGAPGVGSSLHLYLPAQEEDLVRPGSGQHLMLVDDHPGMARVSAKLLETLGYRTSVFDDPREALAAFRAAPQGFDAVLTDLSMPQMSGEDFTRSVLELAPNVPVIVSSGLASELDAEELRKLGVSAILMKPWRLEEAVATLQRVLYPS